MWESFAGNKYAKKFNIHITVNRFTYSAEGRLGLTRKRVDPFGEVASFYNHRINSMVVKCKYLWFLTFTRASLV